MRYDVGAGRMELQHPAEAADMARTKKDQNLKNGAVAYGVWLQETDVLTVHATYTAGMDALVETRCRGDYCDYSPLACCLLVLVDQDGWIVNEHINQPRIPTRPY